MLLKKPKRFHWPVFTRLGALATRWPVLVIALWLIVPAALLFATPSLSDAVRDHPVELVPASAPAMVTEQQMAEAFHESGGENLMLVVLTNDGGLTPADEDIYRTLVTALRADGKDVKMLQDFISSPAMREIVTSKDGKAWILPVGLAGGLDTPEGGEAYKRVVELVHRVTDGTSLKVRHHRAVGHHRRSDRGGRHGPAPHRDRDPGARAGHPGARLPAPGDHAVATDHDRADPADRPWCRGRTVRDRARRLQRDRDPDDRDGGRSRN